MANRVGQIGRKCAIERSGAAQKELQIYFQKSPAFCFKALYLLNKKKLSLFSFLLDAPVMWVVVVHFRWGKRWSDGRSQRNGVLGVLLFQRAPLTTQVVVS